MILKVHKAKTNYSVIRNDLLQEPDISWQAKGIWAYCMTLPENWKINLTDLTNRSTNKRHSTRTALKELEAAGYVKRTRKQRGWETNIYEVKQKVRTQTVLSLEDEDQLSVPPSLNKYSPQKKQLILSLSKEYLQQQKEIHGDRVKVTEKNILKGVEEIEKALRIDKYKLRDVKNYLLYNASDPSLFWNKNLLTLSSLRKKCANDLTKLEYLKIQYEQKHGKRTEKNKVLEVPKRLASVKEHFPLTGTEQEVVLFLIEVDKQFSMFPDKVKDLFKFNGGVRHFCNQFITWLAMMAPKTPHTKTVTGTDNKFWKQFIAKMEKENQISFKTGRRI